MTASEQISADQIADVVLAGLTEGKAVEIDSLGIFYPDQATGFRFEPMCRPRVFLAYVVEDAEIVGRLCDALTAMGYNAWMDSRKLLPGQNLPRAIESAIQTADYFVACFSTRSVKKRGGFQAEIRYALDCAKRLPLDDIFVIPVRLDDCGVPRSIQREIQYINLFPDWRKGLRRLAQAMKRRSG